MNLKYFDLCGLVAVIFMYINSLTLYVFWYSLTLQGLYFKHQTKIYNAYMISGMCATGLSGLYLVYLFLRGLCHKPPIKEYDLLSPHDNQHVN
jgi:hypothetical protein